MIDKQVEVTVGFEGLKMDSDSTREDARALVPIQRAQLGPLTVVREQNLEVTERKLPRFERADHQVALPVALGV